MKYWVTLVQHIAQKVTIEVEAEDEITATDKAEKAAFAGFVDFNVGEADTEIEVISCEEI